MRSVEDLLTTLRALGEVQNIEAKTCQNELGKSILETICAFSNEPDLGVGYILLGVAKQDDLFREYQIVGVSDPDRLQCDLATQCNDVFSVQLRPSVTVHEIEGKFVLLVEVLELPSHLKPVYIKSDKTKKGGGAYRRVATSDIRCSDEDLAALYSAKSGKSYDANIVPDATIAEFDQRAIERYRVVMERSRNSPEILRHDDRSLLYSIGACTDKGMPTIAGAVLFGSDSLLRRLFPRVKVDYVSVPGREWIEDANTRYNAAKSMRTNMFDLVDWTVNTICQDMKTAFGLVDGGLRRVDTPEVPYVAVREAVVNALMHRDYRDTEQVMIVRFSDRLVIRNPGYSLKPAESLYEPGSRPRNPKISEVLHEYGMAETKGMGINAMARLMEGSDLSPPLFNSDRGKNQFSLTFLLHHFINPISIQWLRRFAEYQFNDRDRMALLLAEHQGEISVAEYRDINRVTEVEATVGLKKLLDCRVMLHRHEAGIDLFRLDPKYLDSNKLSTAPAISVLSQGVPPVTTGLSQGVPPLAESKISDPGEARPSQAEEDGTPYVPTPLQVRLKGMPRGLKSLPADLQSMIEELGARATLEDLQNAALRLCLHRSYKPSELALIMNRKPAYLVRRVLGPLREAGRLTYTIPDTPFHADQAYRTVQPSLPEAPAEGGS